MGILTSQCMLSQTVWTYNEKHAVCCSSVLKSSVLVAAAALQATEVQPGNRQPAGRRHLRPAMAPCPGTDHVDCMQESSCRLGASTSARSHHDWHACYHMAWREIAVQLHQLDLSTYGIVRCSRNPERLPCFNSPQLNSFSAAWTAVNANSNQPHKP